MLNARNARGLQAVGDIAQVMRDNIVELRLAPHAPQQPSLPLGWVLSDAAMDILDSGIRDQAGNAAGIANIRTILTAGKVSATKCDNSQCSESVAQKGSSYGGD